ncbi:DUF4367 domain-containing protein [Sedimentibacter hydroxybenzoicus DSM 7310]|uniref:DUF4367 domain-containing protein n=1 Tax=Sedimentibacter hydroxybenzoicus DSM 7310 TaxID=1123245 RepID=A0A974BI33_SEDHY|nr:DUF4367 domain-containing protein [Sedimentibacter hydroxybenzoicus]NYB73217.1 DUF4367 domain-containing protein [Sedimentibacter hydroxybenzoicus DSM 7310]
MELDKKQKESLFDALLTYAVKENAINEINEMPTEEQIKEDMSFSAAFESKMQGLIKRRRNKRILKSTYKYGKKVAVFVSIIVSLGFGTLMTAEAVQNAVISTVVEWYEDHNGFIFKNTSSKSDEEILNEAKIKLPSYIPEGFELSESEDYDSFKLYLYKNKEGINLVFNAAVVTDKNETFIDNEYTDYEIIEINGNEVYLFSGKGRDYDYASVIWTEGNIKYEIDSWIGVIEVIRIAKSLD